MVLVLKSLRQAHIPPIDNEDLWKIGKVCQLHSLAVSRTFQGLRSERFEALCIHVAQKELTPAGKNTSGHIFIVAGLLAGIFAFEGVRCIFQRDGVRRSVRKFHRDAKRRIHHVHRNIRGFGYRQRNRRWLWRGMMAP